MENNGTDMRNMKIAIPVEITDRELYGRLILVNEILSNNKDVVIIFGESISILRNLNILNPDILFITAPDMPDDLLPELIAFKNHNGIIILNENEGGVIIDEESYLKRLRKELFNLVDYYLPWGSYSKEIVLKNGLIEEEKIILAGTPLFDIYSEKYFEYYHVRAKQLINRYDRYILVLCSFGVVTHKIDGWGRKFGQERYAYVLQLFNEFINMISVLSERYKTHRIIVRPHPSENPKYYSQLLNGKNIVINSSGDVNEWIAGAKAVIHNGSTSGISSYLAGKYTLAYKPIIESKYETPLPNKMSIVVKDVKEIQEKIDNVLKVDRKSNLQLEKLNRLKLFIDNTNYSSSQQISTLLRDIMKVSAGNSNQVKEKIKLITIVKRMVKQVFAKIPRLKKSRQYKYFIDKYSKDSDSKISEILVFLNKQTNAKEEIIIEKHSKIPNIMEIKVS